MLNCLRKNFKYILLLLFIFGINSNASAFKIKFTWYNNKKYVYLADIAAYYGMRFNNNKKNSELNSKYSRIKIKHGAKDVYINGRKVFLSEPAIYNGNKPAISEVDFLLLLDPILRKTPLKHHKLTTVIIDPGHGGKDPGGIGKYYKEKNIAFSIALKLKHILSRSGFRVILTRTNDYFISLKSRPALALKYPNSIFVSIHCNIAGNKSVNGVETFIYAPAGTISTHGGHTAPPKMYGNRYDKNNTRLGYEIQKQLINSNKYDITDRGVKHAQFAVLKYCPIPAVLIEAGFLSNNTEEKRLGSNAYQDYISLAIARGIIAYRNAMIKGKG